MQKFILISDEKLEELKEELKPWIKAQSFAYHAGELMAEQILIEYNANLRGFTTFPDRATYGTK